MIEEAEGLAATTRRDTPVRCRVRGTYTISRLEAAGGLLDSQQTLVCCSLEVGLGCVLIWQGDRQGKRCCAAMAVNTEVLFNGHQGGWVNCCCKFVLHVALCCCGLPCSQTCPPASHPYPNYRFWTWAAGCTKLARWSSPWTMEANAA